MSYKIVTRESAEELEQAVNDLLLQGWQCQGGVAVVTWAYIDRDGNTVGMWRFSQALVLSVG